MPDLENGVNLIAYRAASGQLRILIVNHKYRLERTTDLEINLPVSVSDEDSVVHYVVDATHSNYYDTGTGDGTLETVTPPNIVAGKITITMQPRSVHILVVGDESPPTPEGDLTHETTVTWRNLLREAKVENPTGYEGGLVQIPTTTTSKQGNLY